MASVVAWPVVAYAQMTRANPVMPVPIRETVWPALTTVIARIPVGRSGGPAIPAPAMVGRVGPSPRP